MAAIGMLWVAENNLIPKWTPAKGGGMVRWFITVCTWEGLHPSVALMTEASSKTLSVGLLYGALTQQEHPDLERLFAGSR